MFLVCFLYCFFNGLSGSLAIILYSILSVTRGKRLFANSVAFPSGVSTMCVFLLNIPRAIIFATLSADIIRSSLRGVSPCGLPSAVNATFLMFEVVNPGANIMTCKSSYKCSILNVSRKPRTANLEAEKYTRIHKQKRKFKFITAPTRRHTNTNMQMKEKTQQQ